MNSSFFSLLICLTIMAVKSLPAMTFSKILGQVISKVESVEFLNADSCDIIFVGEVNKFYNGNERKNSQIRIKSSAFHNQERIRQINSKCIIVIMELESQNNLNLVKRLVAPFENSMVIAVSANSNESIGTNWTEEELNQFPRNMIVLKIQENVVSQSVFCTQNRNHLWIDHVNVWMPERNPSPVIPLSETMPRKVCPHPLKGKTVLFGYARGAPHVLESSTSELGLVGFEVSLARLLRDKFGFGMRFQFSAPGIFNETSGKWTGRFGMLAYGNLDVAICGATARVPLQTIMDFTRVFYSFDMRWWSRKPVPLPKYDQFIIAYPGEVWGVILVTYAAMSVCFALSYRVYKRVAHFGPGWIGPLTHPLDFVLLTFSTLREPHPIPWFPRMSAGKLLVVLWVIFNWFISAFYVSMLRGDLMSQDYEKPIDTSADVVERDQKVFLNGGTYNAYFKNVRIPNAMTAKAIAMAEDRNGIYGINLLDKGQAPLEARRDIFTKGVILAIHTLAFRASYVLDSTMSLDRVHGSKEVFLNGYFLFQMRKSFLWKRGFDRVIGQAFDMGLIDKFINLELPHERQSYSLTTKKMDDDATPINIKQIVSMLFFLGGGLALAVITFILEISYDFFFNFQFRFFN